MRTSNLFTALKSESLGMLLILAGGSVGVIHHIELSNFGVLAKFGLSNLYSRELD